MNYNLNSLLIHPPHILYSTLTHPSLNLTCSWLAQLSNCPGFLVHKFIISSLSPCSFPTLVSEKKQSCPRGHPWPRALLFVNLHRLICIQFLIHTQILVFSQEISPGFGFIYLFFCQLDN